MQEPDYHQHEEFQLRTQKLQQLRQLPLDPYPAQFTPSDHAEGLSRQYEHETLGHSDDAAAGVTPSVKIAGRVVLFRAMGKNAFLTLQDGGGRIQVMLNREQTHVVGFTPSEAESHMKFLEKRVDLGDWIGVEGHLFRTQKGELTVFAKQVTLLCKTLLPLPDKHAGLVDKEIRYRKRWLDLIVHPEVRQTFLRRSLLIKLIRQYFGEQGFIEVETPVLQNVYGGAAARPFMTHLNALDTEMFLRISLEIPLKELLIGGLERVFEIGKVFRNEGIDKTHNPEFTMLEAYAAYWDYNDMMRLVENLLERLALELHGTTEVRALAKDGTEHTVSFKTPWRRMTMYGAIQTYGGIDVEGQSDEQLRQALRDRTHLDPTTFAKAPRGLLIQLLFEELCEKHLIQPHHIIDHPIETTPLCKLHRDPARRALGLVERFESFVLGGELCNSYTELNDPELQRSLLVDQAAQRDAGNEEASPLDEEFIEAICQGMPPAGGLGIGIDRLVMMMTHAESIRDVLFFPLMRPECHGEEAHAAGTDQV
ncbi:MAG: lysine--tRNA ligase [Chlamydiia bacterium]